MTVTSTREPVDRLYCEEYGADGSTILWLHGLDGPGPDLPVVERLAVNHRVLVPTFPGFDDVARPAYCDDIIDLVHLTAELLEREASDDVIVIGVSFGGWVAAELSVWRPDRLSRLILVDALGIRVGEPTDRDIADLFVVSEQDSRELLFADVAKAGPLFAALDEDALLRRLRSQEATVVYGWEPYMCNPKLRRRLASVAVPTRVIWGAEDRMVSPSYGRAYADAFADASFVELDGAGHNAHIEDPDAFLEVVGQFLATR